MLAAVATRRRRAGAGTYEAITLQVRLLDALRLGDGILADDLDPVAVRVQGEGDAAHAAVAQFLLELVAGVFEALAGGLDAVDADADVAEAFARVAVAVGDFEVGVGLGAVVVGQLEDAFAVGPVVVGGGGLRRVVGEEVEVEFVVRECELVDLFEAEEFVVFDWREGLVAARGWGGGRVGGPDALGSLTRSIVSKWCLVRASF